MSGECPVGRTVYGAPCNGPGTYYCDSDVWGSACRRYFEQDAPTPAVPDNAELREAVARWLAKREDRVPYDAASEHHRAGWLRDADALLSGPLAALLAERDDLAAKVAAVRELSAYWDVAEAHPDVMRDDLRRALGAPLTTATDEENDR